MPFAPKTSEELGFTVPPVYIKNGIIHLHYSRRIGGAPEQPFKWMVMERRVEGICGTDRCLLLKTVIGPDGRYWSGKCEHHWQPVPPLTFQCTKCDELNQFELGSLAD